MGATDSSPAWWVWSSPRGGQSSESVAAGLRFIQSVMMDGGAGDEAKVLHELSGRGPEATLTSFFQADTLKQGTRQMSPTAGARARC